MVEEKIKVTSQGGFENTNNGYKQFSMTRSFARVREILWFLVVLAKG